MDRLSCKKQRLNDSNVLSESKMLNIFVQLYCKKTNLSEEGVITFESPPRDVFDIKKQVEKQFNIPTCVQNISYNGLTIKHTITLSSLSVRDGDTFHIEYLAKGDCSDIMVIVLWLRQISDICANAGDSSYLTDVVENGIEQNLLKNLEGTFFSPWDDPRTYVNKLYFADSGGVCVILKVYEFLLQNEWNQLDRNLKYLEWGIIECMWSFMETAPLERLLIQYNIVSMLVKSVLRVKLMKGRDVYGYDTSGDEYQQSLLFEAIYNSIGVLANVTELPECRLEIASNKAVLQQICYFFSSPSLSSSYLRTYMLFFCNLASTSETHQYIADSVYSLLRTCRMISSDHPGNQFILIYFPMLLSLSQVSLISPHCLEPNRLVCQIITEKMKSFLQTTTYEKVKDVEISIESNCTTLIPYLKLLYVPNTPRAQEDETTTGKLQLVSLQFAIFALQSWLGREINRQVLLKEGLLDYVVCMPQYVPPSLRPQAEELVQMVVSLPDIPEGPPKLLNLVKAKLAKMHFGLEQVLSLSVGEILYNLYSTTL